MSTGKTYSTKYLLDSNNNRGAEGQVLSTTSTGINWIDGSAIPGVPGGSGTLNKVPLWTPDGDTLGDSILSQNGTSIYQGVAGTSASGYYYFNTTTTGDSGLLFADNTSTNSGFLTYNHDVDAMKFGTSNTERMRIDSSGLVGINVTSPQTRLQTNLGITGAYLGYLNGTASTFDMSANVAVVHNSPAIGNGTGAGLVLANNDKSDGAPSPIIAFSAKSASNSYNHTYAAIYGVRTATGADTNWTKGDLVFATGDGTGPIERMRILANGNVGIGEDNPTSLLHLYKASGDPMLNIQAVSAGDPGITFTSINNRTGNIFYSDGTTNAKLTYDHADTSFKLYAHNTSVADFVLNETTSYFPTQNVGIGLTPNASYSNLQIKTPSSAYGLDLVGRDAGSSSESQITFWNSNQTSVLAAVVNSSDSLLFYTGTTERMRITSNGVLQLTSGINGYLNSNSIGMEMDINRNPETGGFKDAGLSHARIIMRGDTTANGGSNIKFVTSPTVNTVGTTKMTITGDGLVGIGTDLPTNSLLHLYKDGDTVLRLTAGNSSISSIQFGDITDQTRGRIFYNSSDDMVFATNNNAEKMRIEAGGNVGIGTTNPGAKLVVTDDNDGQDATFKVNHTRSDSNVATQAIEVNMTLSGADTTTADRVNSGILVDVVSTADGDTSNEHRLYGVYSDVTYSGMSDLVRGGYFKAESNNNTEKTAQTIGIYGQAVHDASSANGGVTTLAGVYGVASLQDTGDVTNTYGGFFLADIPDTRDTDVNVVKGVEGHIDINKATAISYGNMSAVSAVIDNNEGAVPNFSDQYLFKGDYQGDKGSNAYGVYCEGDKHYLQGSVGIGILNPAQPLHVSGNARVTGAYYDSNNSPGAVNQVLVSTVTGTDWVDASGSSIIGGPYLPLAGGTMTGAITMNDNVPINFGTGGSTDSRIFYDALDLNIESQGGKIFIVKDVTDLSTGIVLDSSSNVAIGAAGGASASGAKLTVTGNTYVSGTVQVPDNGKLAAGSSLDLQIFHNGSHGFVTNGTGDLNLSTTSGGLYITQFNDDGDIILQCDDGSGGVANYLTLDGDTTHAYFSNPGNVGIGTTSPGSILTVRKDTVGGRGGEISIVNYATTTVGNEAALNFGLEGSTYHADLGNAQIKARVIASNAATDMIFSTWNGTSFGERMRIDSTGNVGIGTTSPATKLEVNSGSTTAAAQFTGTSSNSEIYIGTSGVQSGYTNLAFYSDSGNAQIWKSGTGYTGYGGTSALNIYNSNGKIAFHPAGNANAMLIDTNSNVGIGTTSPGEKLEVDGHIKVLGRLKLGPSSSIQLDDTPTASTANSSGTIVNWSVSESTTAGTLYAVKTNGGWTAADADSEVKSTYMLAIALGTNSNQGMLLQGFFYKASHGFTIGAPLYVSNTLGAFSNSRPTGSGDYVRIIGYATSTNYIYFDPDKTWVKIA